MNVCLIQWTRLRAIGALAAVALLGAANAVAADRFLADCIAACGVADPCEAAWIRSQYDELAARVAPRSLRRLPAGERLRELHTRLHAEILVGEYRKDASDLRLAIGRGDYNCLSATALYFDLAREAGVELEIWSLPGHVLLCCSEAESPVIDPGSRQWRSPRASSAGLPDSRLLTPDQLVGKFHYNRGVLALERRDFADGIRCLHESLKLDPADEQARANLLAGLNNWAVELCRHERYAPAHALLRQGLAIDPDFAPLVANERQLRAKLQP